MTAWSKCSFESDDVKRKPWKVPKQVSLLKSFKFVMVRVKHEHSSIKCSAVSSDCSIVVSQHEQITRKVEKDELKEREAKRRRISSSSTSPSKKKKTVTMVVKGSSPGKKQETER